jgi:Fe(3+) dicitrate transport protein
MDYQMKQSGGLTDAQFEANPQSFRNRNWFEPMECQYN